jgi:uncharacterized damage-inducible protein DinB
MRHGRFSVSMALIEKGIEGFLTAAPICISSTSDQSREEREMTITERLLQHDAWTTRALLHLSAHLAGDQLDREFDIGHRSLRRTFEHIVANMECWCDLMYGKPQRGQLRAAASPNTIAELTDRLDVVAGQLLALGRKVVEEAREDESFTDYLDEPPKRKPLGAGLVHIATHGMHHRAQCLYIMRQLGITNLPEGDAMSWERIHRGLTAWPAA